MEKIKFLKTDDESIGLYSESVGDIFHSKTGALKEAKEKFCVPVMLCEFYKKKNEINILDICYGIGYNTKASISLFEQKKLNITALEYNIDFILMSPFINDGINNSELKFDLIYNFFSSGVTPERLLSLFQDISSNDCSNIYFTPAVEFIKHLSSLGDIYNPLNEHRSLLHNIYYQYISKDMKNSPKDNSYADFNFKYFTGDARESISKINDYFDVVFLDAFSSQKDPTLWTIDFLSAVVSKMMKNSILVSYSKSTPFRSALSKLGLFVGKTLIDNNDFGTVASFSKENIVCPLDDYDLDLMSTRSGIPYKDPCLNFSPDLILKNRLDEMNNSKLISQTQFLKNNRKKYY